HPDALTDITSETIELPENSIDRDWQEAVVLGLSDYLIERTEQEAIFIFYEEVYQKLLAPNSFLSDTLFYNFSRLLRPLENPDDQLFEANLDVVKEALNQDVDHLADNLIKHPRLRESEALVALYYATHLINHLKEGRSIQNAFEKTLQEIPGQITGRTPLERGIILMAQLIKDSKYVNLEKLYIGHDTAQLKAMTKILTVQLTKNYPSTITAEQYDEMTIHIKNILLKYREVEETLKKYKADLSKIDPTADFEEYRQFKRKRILTMIRMVTELLQESIPLVEFIPDLSAPIKFEEKVNELSNQMTNAIESWFLLEDRKYAEAMALIIPMIPNLPIKRLENLTDKQKERFRYIRTELLKDDLKNHLTIVDTLLENHLINLYEKTYQFENKDQATAFLKKHGLTFLDSLLVYERGGKKFEVQVPPSMSKKELEYLYLYYLQKFRNKNKRISQLRFLPFPKQVTLSEKDYKRFNKTFIQYFSTVSIDEKLNKLLALAGEASTARTAGDVKKVFQKYALPVASYRIKRREPNQLMINAYVGGGVTKIERSSLNFQSEPVWVLNAPVGLEYSNPMRIDSFYKGSWSVFLPLLDVGNVINYRIEDPADDRDVQIEEILSPGIYVVFGLSNRFPFSLGVGYQGNPNRLGAFIAFDLPLFKLR
ncbi:MAG: hypothetical protein WBA74_00530, partial [Cyclobacteriaceae bacterium]